MEDHFEQKAKSASDQKIVDVLSKPDDYNEIALQAYQTEFDRRGLDKASLRVIRNDATVNQKRLQTEGLEGAEKLLYVLFPFRNVIWSEHRRMQGASRKNEEAATYSLIGMAIYGIIFALILWARLS